MLRAGAPAPQTVKAELRETAKYLGVTFSHTLNWEPHVRLAMNRARGLALEIGRMRTQSRGVLSRQSLGMAWLNFARSYVEWSCAAWGFVPKKVLEAAEVVQMQALRAAAGAGDAGHLCNAALRRLFGAWPLAERRTLLRARFAHATLVAAATFPERSPPRCDRSRGEGQFERLRSHSHRLDPGPGLLSCLLFSAKVISAVNG